MIKRKGRPPLFAERLVEIEVGITREQEAFLQSLVEQGDYDSFRAAIRGAIDHLKEEVS